MNRRFGPGASPLLHSILCRAASPKDRVSRYFSPLARQCPGLVERRIEAWRFAAAGPDPEAFNRLLEACGLSLAQLKAQCSDVELADDVDLPPWAALLSEFEAMPDGGSEAPAGASAPYHPWILLGRQKLQAVFARTGEWPTPAAELGMVHSLSGRLYRACRNALEQELRLLALARGCFLGPTPELVRAFNATFSTRTGWMACFDCLPALARVVAWVFLNWLDSVQECLERLQADRGFLAEQLFQGRDPGILDHFSGDAGDLHHHGRTAVILGFAGGARVVYKPKDLRIGATFMTLQERLFRHGLPLPLHSRKILVRGDHTWEEFAARAECADLAGVGRFYFRMGMLLRLLQLLEGQDFWLDNVVAHGEYPVPVDLEMLCQPRKDSVRPDEPWADQEARLHIQDSALPVGLLPLKYPLEPGVRAMEMAALSSEPFLETPIRALAWFDALTPSRNRSTSQAGFLMLRVEDHIPCLDGLPARAADHFDDLLAGYQGADRCLEHQWDAVAGLLEPLEQVPVRFILRSTWTYYTVNHVSTAPRYLKDGLERELVLGRLWRSGLKQGTPPEVIESEIASCRELDIPFFQAQPGSRKILVEGRESGPDYFSSSALERIRPRLSSWGPEVREAQLDLIRSSFATLDPGSFRVPGPYGPAGTAAVSISAEGLLAAAVAIADGILGLALKSAGGLSWIGLVHHPWTDMLRVEPLPPDLVNGTCGLALLFADLAGVTREPRFQTALEALLAELALAAGTQIRALVALEAASAAPGSSWIPCGSGVGLGSQLFALLRCGHPGGPELLRQLPLSAIRTYCPADMVSGRAGLLLSLLPFAGACPEIEGIARQLGESLRGELRAGTARTLVPPGTTYLDALPDQPDGIALALHRWSGQGALPECRGQTRTPGRLLAEGSMTDAETFLPLADAFTGAVTPASPSELLLEAMEIRISSFQKLGRREDHAAACLLAQELIARKERFQTWFPENRARDRHYLSAIRGVGAVAHALLRLAAPHRISSLRIPSRPILPARNPAIGGSSPQTPVPGGPRAQPW